jgi:hypothetical protein
LVGEVVEAVAVVVVVVAVGGGGIRTRGEIETKAQILAMRHDTTGNQ